MKNLCKHFLPAAAVLSLLAAPTFAASPGASSTSISGPLTVTPNACTITQTVVSVTTTSASLVAANTNRKSLRWMNTGTAAATIIPGTGTATAGTGMVYAAAPVSGGQGGSETIGDAAVATNAFQVIAPAATSVTVWECS